MELFSTIPFYWTFENGRLDIFLALEVTYKEIIIIVFFLKYVLLIVLPYIFRSQEHAKNSLHQTSRLPDLVHIGMFINKCFLDLSIFSANVSNCLSCVNPQRNVALVFNKQLIQRDIKTYVDMFIKYYSIALKVQLLRGKEWIPVIKVFISRTFWTSSLRMGKKKKNKTEYIENRL